MLVVVLDEYALARLPPMQRRQQASPLDSAIGLDAGAIDRMIEGVRQVDALPDPIGAISEVRPMPSGAITKNFVASSGCNLKAKGGNPCACC